MVTVEVGVAEAVGVQLLVGVLVKVLVPVAVKVQVMVGVGEFIFVGVAVGEKVGVRVKVGVAPAWKVTITAEARGKLTRNPPWALGWITVVEGAGKTPVVAFIVTPPYPKPTVSTVESTVGAVSRSTSADAMLLSSETVTEPEAVRSLLIRKSSGSHPAHPAP